jgi:hypothetical protein
MSRFIAVDDQLLIDRIAAVRRRIVFVAPAVSKEVATALGGCLRRADRISITLVLDPYAEAHRIGYGDREGLEKLRDLAKDNHIGLRSQPGLRMGLLLADDEVLIWSPTPRAVEDQRRVDQPNGIDLSAAIGAVRTVTSRGDDASEVPCVGKTEGEAGSLADIIRNAVGADDSNVLPSTAEIGRKPFTPEQLAETVKELTDNPPARFDLSRKTRVFSTKFQFIDFERRGAAWTEREIKLSSLLFNPDVPDELKDLFETRVRPFSAHANLAIEVPTLVQGQIAYSREGEPILSAMTQTDMEREWNKLKERYLQSLKGFGWLMHKPDRPAFDAAVAAYQTVLRKWVTGFREVAAKDEANLVDQLVGVINARATQPAAKGKLKDMDIKKIVSEGISRLRIVEPSVKLVFKEISWESTRDAEFADALQKAFPGKDFENWFEEFTAARERSS